MERSPLPLRVIDLARGPYGAVVFHRPVDEVLEQAEQGRARGHEAAACLVLGQVVEARREQGTVLVDEGEQLLAGRRVDGDLVLEEKAAKKNLKAGL